MREEKEKDKEWKKKKKVNPKYKHTPRRQYER